MAHALDRMHLHRIQSSSLAALQSATGSFDTNKTPAVAEDIGVDSMVTGEFIELDISFTDDNGNRFVRIERSTSSLAQATDHAFVQLLEAAPSYAASNFKI